MTEIEKPSAVPSRVEAGYKVSRVGAKTVQNDLHTAQDTPHVAVGKRRRYEAHDFAVSSFAVAVDKLDRVRSKVLFFGKRLEEAVEMSSKPGLGR